MASTCAESKTGVAGWYVDGQTVVVGFLCLLVAWILFVPRKAR